ncbi:MAG: glycosyltransferase [Paramuribaculum sp.]|nr:glycosyltransferase [Paramuribaculum sp.]
MKKEKVLIVTKFYYRRGGDCVCAINLENLLRARGHEVAVFAMKHPDNLQSEWEAYWPEEVSFGGGVKNKVNAVKRTLGMGDVAANFERMLRDFKPDVVHLHNIHSYLSPVVAKLAKKFGARVVWTLHDYKLICPAYSCLRDGKTCELCYTSKRHVLTTRCMKGSMAASAIAWLEAEWWNRKKLERYTDAFVCPSSFMAGKMAQGGFAPDKLNVLCNFVASEMAEKLACGSEASKPQDYYCYIGRLSPEKGVGTLLEAASRLPYELRVVGDGSLMDEFRAKYGDCANIKLLGRKDPAEVLEVLKRARFSVMPSECYENNPMGVIESLCAGTPVIGAAIGGIPELIDDQCGTTYPSGDAVALVESIKRMWDMTFDRNAIKRRSMTLYTPDVHYAKLIDIYRGTAE